MQCNLFDLIWCDILQYNVCMCSSYRSTVGEIWWISFLVLFSVAPLHISDISTAWASWIFFWLGNGQSFWFCSRCAQRLDLGVLPGLQCVLDPARQVLRRAHQHRQRPAEKMRGYQAYGQPGTREGFHLSREVWCGQLFCWLWELYGRFCVIRMWTENQEWLGIVGRNPWLRNDSSPAIGDGGVCRHHGRLAWSGNPDGWQRQPCREG